MQAVVLEAVYPAVDVAVENRLRMRLGPLGSAVAPLLLVQLRPRLGVWPSELKPVDHVALLRCPILVIGGTRDQHTTLADNRRLYAAAHEPKELWLIPDVAHVGYHRATGSEYQRRVWNFSIAHSGIDRRMQLPDRLSSQWITSRFLTHE